MAPRPDPLGHQGARARRARDAAARRRTVPARVVISGDSLQTVVRNLSSGPLRIEGDAGSAGGTSTTFGDAAPYAPGEPTWGSRSGAGGDQLISVRRSRSARCASGSAGSADHRPGGRPPGLMPTTSTTLTASRRRTTADDASPHSPRAAPARHPRLHGSIGSRPSTSSSRSRGRARVRRASAPAATGRRCSSRPSARRPADRARGSACRRAGQRGLDRRRGPRGPRRARRARRRGRAAISSSTRSSARPGCVPTVAALGEGIDLALANKESLVVGGELVDPARRGDRSGDHPRRLRALGAAPADLRRASGDRRAAGPDGLGRAVPGARRGASSRPSRSSRRSRTRRGRWAARSRSTRRR